MYEILCLQVYLYSVVFSGDNQISLHKVSVLSNSYLATNVVTLGEDVLIGDAMHSVTLLRKDQKELKTVSRCHTALWPVSMEFNGKHDLIIANVSISSLLILECMSDASISVTEIYTR